MSSAGGGRGVEHEGRGSRHHGGRHPDPDRRDDQCRRSDRAERSRGAHEAALVEDHDEGDDADRLSEAGVRQVDDRQPVAADDHAETEEEQQARSSQPLGEPGAHHPGDEEDRAAQQQRVDREPGGHHPPSRRAPVASPASWWAPTVEPAGDEGRRPPARRVAPLGGGTAAPARGSAARRAMTGDDTRSPAVEDFRRMTDDGAKAELHQRLRGVRAALLWKLEGLGDLDVRRPLTRSGTNLLGWSSTSPSPSPCTSVTSSGGPLPTGRRGGGTTTPGSSRARGPPPTRPVRRSSTATDGSGSTRTRPSRPWPSVRRDTCRGGHVQR
jgi:hypothetical protein